MELNSLTSEQRKKLATCKSTEEIYSLAREEGVELSDEDLSQVSGGWGDDGGGVKCIECGSTNVSSIARNTGIEVVKDYTCRDCGTSWSDTY